MRHWQRGRVGRAAEGHRAGRTEEADGGIEVDARLEKGDCVRAAREGARSRSFGAEARGGGDAAAHGLREAARSQGGVC